ncbi:hypothetical protein [Streptomyces sp. TRM64462]|uniref:hypothetical protein n=1 Tax=Streptomyces sp. TRM64462 TaxID=2741726 RepID=UPI0015864CA5|nr:hypothetical protein [Streptomyces sp. TRM64462]
MYLIHLHLAPHPVGLPLPEDTAAVVTDAVRPGSGVVRHVTVHPADGHGLVVGLYVAADGPEQAEAAARVTWWRAVAARPRLGGWPLLSTELAMTLDRTP